MVDEPATKGIESHQNQDAPKHIGVEYWLTVYFLKCWWKKIVFFFVTLGSTTHRVFKDDQILICTWCLWDKWAIFHEIFHVEGVIFVKDFWWFWGFSANHFFLIYNRPIVCNWSRNSILKEHVLMTFCTGGHPNTRFWIVDLLFPLAVWFFAIHNKNRYMIAYVVCHSQPKHVFFPFEDIIGIH